MTAIAEKLFADLLALPETDLAEISRLLLDSLAPGMSEDDPGFLEELDRRKGDMLSGKSIPIPYEDAMAQLDAHIASLRR